MSQKCDLSVVKHLHQETRFLLKKNRRRKRRNQPLQGLDSNFFFFDVRHLKYSSFSLFLAFKRTKHNHICSPRVLNKSWSLDFLQKPKSTGKSSISESENKKTSRKNDVSKQRMCGKTGIDLNRIQIGDLDFIKSQLLILLQCNQISEAWQLKS